MSIFCVFVDEIIDFCLNILEMQNKDDLLLFVACKELALKNS